MTTFTPEALQALAEALASPAKELAAGLLRRPLPERGARPAALDELALRLADLHTVAVPALREAVEGLGETGADDAEEAVEDLVDPLFDLVEGARELHRAALTPEAEALRPYLIAIAEDPLTDALELFLHIIQAALNPWGLLEDPERPELDLSAKPDAPAHLEALRDLCRARPGLLPEAALDRLSAAVAASAR